jgi:class 3 adenylate cyclase
MAVCRTCGAAASEDARFCARCGAALEQAPPREARKVVTVLFCDLASSTELSERLEPEALRHVLERYFSCAREALEHHGGTVEKFIGDAVMGVFGIPIVHEDDALRAVRAAADLRDAVVRLNADLSATGVELLLRIGVNTGEVIAGDRPDEALVTGDAVVTAKRLEEAAPLGGVLLGPRTYALVQDAVEVDSPPPVALKGKAEPLAARILRSIRPGAPGRARRLDSPLVGREEELGALRDVYALALSARECRLVSVLGPAGIGKTRLTHELVSAFPEARALRGRCLPYGEGITYWPLVEIVREATGLSGGEAPDAARVRIEELVADRPEPERIATGVAAAVGLGDEVPAEELFWAVRSFFEALAAAGPLLVLLDDLQWAEAAFLDLVEYLASRSRAAPILLCCLARAELLDVRPQWAVPRDGSATIVLPALPAEDSRALVGNLLGEGIPESLRDRVLGAAEGNPLFVEELLRMLIDDGVLRRTDSGWQLEADPGRLQLPPTINALLTARLDRLAPEERRVIEHAAVIGEVFSWSALAALVPSENGGSVGACLQRLVQKELIRPAPAAAGGGEDEFRFGHILVRDAAYATLPKNARAHLHERAARLIELRYAGAIDVDEIGGYHLEQASRAHAELDPFGTRGKELAAEAAARLEAAGRRAVTRGDAGAAATLLERTLSLLVPDDPARPGLLVELADSLRLTGRLDESERRLGEAGALAESSGDEAGAVRAALDRAFLRIYTDPAEGTDALLGIAEEAAALFERLEDDAGLVHALAIAADVYWIRSEIAAMQRALERALPIIAAATPTERTRVRSALARAAMFGPTRVEDGLLLCDDLIRLAETDRTLAAIVDVFAAYLEGLAGRFDAARLRLGRARTTLSELGKQLLLVSQCLFAGQVELLAGDPLAAEARFREAYRILESAGAEGNRGGVTVHLALALHAQGRDDEAETLVAEAARRGRPDDVELQVLWRVARARIRAAGGAADEAQMLAAEAVAIAEKTDAPNLRADAQLALARALSVQGRDGEARAAAGEALACYEAKGNVVGAAEARTFVEAPLRAR